MNTTKPINWFVINKQTKRVVTSFASRERAREFAKDNDGTVKHIDDLTSEQVASISAAAVLADVVPAPVVAEVASEPVATDDVRPEPKTLREKLVRKVEDMNAKTAMRTFTAPKAAKKRVDSDEATLLALDVAIDGLLQAKTNPCEVVRVATVLFPKVRRAEMLAACVKLGMNKHTVSRQFGLTRNGSVKPTNKD
jgi:hypothetical protein